MKQPKPAAEFEQFARDKDHDVEDGLVFFKQEDEARKFEIEARDAGFDVVTVPDSGSYARLDKLSEGPNWIVRLAF